MKTAIFLLCVLLLAGQASASHLRGGYIQTRSVSATALTYEVTVTIYHEGSAASMGENSITLCLGDGSSQEVLRQSRRITTDGLLSISTYRLVHTYAGPGTYTLTTALVGRTTARNIAGATEHDRLALTTTFSTNTGPNQTPTLVLPATGLQAATNQPLILPLNTTDAEGDSLAYSLTRPLISSATITCSSRPVATYQYPNDLTRRGIYNLNNRTGNLTWDAPVEPGNYSVAMTVGEYRSGILISQTLIDVSLSVVDRPGTPGVIPPYEPARESSLVTALPNYRDEDLTLTVFPNPVEDRLQVVIQTSNPATARTRMIDSNGRILHEITFGRLARQHEQVISLGSLTPGVYVLRAETGGQTLVQKVIKK
jgi:hypothetical protein